MTLIKVCGITTPEDACMLAELGVDYIGLNFWPQSKRHVEIDHATTIAEEVRRQTPSIQIVGLFVNQSQEEIATVQSAVGIDWVQLHGDEDEAFANTYVNHCIKVLPLATENDLLLADSFPDCTLLVDSHSPDRGGSGMRANWPLAATISQSRNIWLAGGLTPDNVADAIRTVQPYGVDVASGVELRPGIKSSVLVAQFVEEVRGIHES